MPKKKTPATRASDAGLASSQVSQSIGGRDDFKQPTKVRLAQRVGYLCSNPECQAPTIGPRMGEPGVANVGVAAHIKAASKGFARYDEHQTPEERGGFDNGIWLCQTHATQIDRDEKTFTVELLHEWKEKAEQRAFEQLLSGHGPARVYRPAEELAEQVAELRALLALPQDTDVDTLRARVAAGSLTQIEAFERSDRWPRHLLELELAAEGSDNNARLELGRFSALLSATQKIVLVSQPGTGKSTTLVQIARRMLAQGPVPAIVPLAEWAEGRTDLFGWLVARHGYEGLPTNHLKFLAHQGELALLLDGYNEVPAEARVTLMQELKTLQRDYPLLSIVMSSRRETRNLPLAGHRLVVMPLSDEQQLEMATAMRGKGGASLLDAAWRTPGLADLVTIPLYLRSLLEIAPGTALPETKEEVLRGLVRTHESESTSLEIFHQRLLDEQQQYLTALAVAAQKLGGPTLPEAEAKRVVGAANRAIIEEGLTAAPLGAPQVLDVLVASHTLVRDAGGTFSFQHQQIQEWYASLDFEVALDGVADQLSMIHPFAAERLNDPNWGEVMMFACERMSRRDGTGAAAVATVIDLMLSIDPLFAAKLISRSGDAVWAIVASKVVRFGEAWHTSGSPLSIAFMIESRRPEFSNKVWPLVSETENRQMANMRLVQRFNPGVLGQRLAAQYATLSDRARETLVVELASSGDRAGIDMAHQLALSEPSVEIRLRVFESLSFRLATYQMEDLLRQSGEGLADEVARRGYWDGLRDKDLLADLVHRQKRLLANETSPERQLSRALHTFEVAELPALIHKALIDPAYPIQDHGARTLHAAWVRFPVEVAAALKERVEKGLKLPFRPQLYLNAAPPTDRGPILDIVLGDTADSEDIGAAAYLAGPKAVRELLLRYAAAHRKWETEGIRTESAYRPVDRIAKILSNTRANVLFDALRTIEKDVTVEDIDGFARIVSGHGQAADLGEVWLSDGDMDAAAALLTRWGQRLLDEGASRHDMAQLTRAMKRVPHPMQVPVITKMLKYDLSMRAKSRAAFEVDRRNKDALQDWRYSHESEFRTILTDIGTAEAEEVLRQGLSDPAFETEAAIGLQVMWRQRNEPSPPKSHFKQFPDFERAAQLRVMGPRELSCTAGALLKAAETLLDEGSPSAIARAASIAGNAVLLPHGERQQWFEGLLSRELPDRCRLDLSRRMAAGGLLVPSQVILSALAALVSKYEGRSGWVHDNETWEFIQWVELLPASERPAALLEGLDLISDFKFGHWQVRDALAGLRLLPEAERIELLRGVITRYPKYAEQYAFDLSLRNPGVPTLEFLIDIAAGTFGNISIDKGTRFDFPDELYYALGEKERASLAERYDGAVNDGARVFLGRLLLASGQHEACIELCQTKVGRHIIKREGYRTLEKFLYVRQPVSRDSSTYELLPRNVEALRKGLFALTGSHDEQTAAFAAEYLSSIDLSRAEAGATDNGTRHPDISSGRPWPAVTVAVETTSV